MKVVVTGSSGKAGRAVVATLLEHDFDVHAVDLVAPAQSTAPFLHADLTEFGQTLECPAGMDGVVHLAAIPASGIRTEETRSATAVAWALAIRDRRNGRKWVRSPELHSSTRFVTSVYATQRG